MDQAIEQIESLAHANIHSNERHLEAPPEATDTGVRKTNGEVRGTMN